MSEPRKLSARHRDITRKTCGSHRTDCIGNVCSRSHPGQTAPATWPPRSTGSYGSWVGRAMHQNGTILKTTSQTRWPRAGASSAATKKNFLCSELRGLLYCSNSGEVGGELTLEAALAASLKDVWCSSDGSNWECVTTKAPWAPVSGNINSARSWSFFFQLVHFSHSLFTALYDFWQQRWLLRPPR